MLHAHKIGDTLRAKGVAFAENIVVYEVCNPVKAAKVLSADMQLCSALPCRIAVFTEQQGKVVKVSQMSPGAMMQMFASSGVIDAAHTQMLREVATEVETATREMIEEAASAPAASDAAAVAK